MMWPDYAVLLHDEFTTKRDWGLLRTDMDNGIAKQRNRYSRPMIVLGGAVLVASYAARVNFDQWVDSLAAGWFDLPLHGEIVTARFTDQIQWAMAGQGWRGTVAMEALG